MTGSGEHWKKAAHVPSASLPLSKRKDTGKSFSGCESYTIWTRGRAQCIFSAYQKKYIVHIQVKICMIRMYNNM